MADGRARGRLLDATLIVLAGASVLVFALHVGADLDAGATRLLVTADLAIVGAYALIFLAKGLLDERPARWFARHSWLAFALLPLTIPLLLAQPYLLALQVLILLLRCGKAIDRALHLHVMAGLTERYRARLVEELTQPLLLDLARVMEDAVTSRDYAAAMGERLHERRALIEAAVRRGIESSPRLSTLSRLGPVQRWVDDTTREVVDAAHVALTGPELNTVIREAFHDAFDKLREGINEPKWPRRGIGVREAAHKLGDEAARALHVAPAAAGPL